MISSKTILILLLILCLNNASIIAENAIIDETETCNDSNLFSTPGNTSTTPQYEFVNPQLAYHILSELDTSNHEDYIPQDFEQESPEDFPALGLKNDDHYCEKHRAAFVTNPNIVFNEINFVVKHKELIRENVLKPLGNDTYPGTARSAFAEAKKKRTVVDIDPRVTIFFTKSALAGKVIGKHYACISQASNNVPGNMVIHSKNRVAEAVAKYGKIYKDMPQCFNDKKFFPKTWLLYNRQDCQAFFAALNSPQYLELKAERRIVYIRKDAANVHMGLGVQPVNDEEEATLKLDYGNGELCGKVKKNYIVQDYIYNPVLLEGRKFDFRMYMLVASVNPLIVYYHDGFLRVSVQKYDPNSNDKKVLLTNIALSKDIYSNIQEGVLYNDMNEDELRHSQQWNFARLQAYLLETGVINDPNWLDNYLRPEFKKAMVHLVRLAPFTYTKSSSVFRLYGIDFMLDSNLNLWFLEANSSPGVGTYTPDVYPIILKMYKDEMEIAIGLLRSRMKRVLNYVNNLIKEDLVQVRENGEVFIEDMEKRREEFQAITRNYFEKEYEPSPDNSFSKIVDGNLEGVERYYGFIDQECLGVTF